MAHADLRRVSRACWTCPLAEDVRWLRSTGWLATHAAAALVAKSLPHWSFLVFTEVMGSCGGRISAVLFLLLLLAVVQTGLGAASSQDGSHGDSNQTDPMCSNTGAEGPKSNIKVASLKFEEVEAPLYVLIFILVVVLAKMGQL